MKAINSKMSTNPLANALRKKAEVIPDLDIEETVPQPTAAAEQADAKVEVINPEGKGETKPEDNAVKQAPAASAPEEQMKPETPETPEGQQTKFLSDDIVEMLAQQVGNEMTAFYEYTAINAWCDGVGLPGFTAWTAKQACDEMAHMKKVLRYLTIAGVSPKLPSISGTVTSYADVKATVDAIYSREKEVTANWRAIAKKALQDADAGTCALAQWFVTEQMEEEDTVEAVKFRLSIGSVLEVDLQLMEQYGD